MTDPASFAPDHASAAVRPSPNFGERRDDASVSMLILHYTGMEDGPSAEDWLCAAESEVSSHYIVHEDGRIVQMVPEASRAWHAGASTWEGRTDINSCSIGIEIVNAGHPGGLPDYPTAQITAVIDLCQGVIERHDIKPWHVLGHSDVAPGRKVDPGEKFPWKVLSHSKIGHFVDESTLGGGNYFGRGEQGQPIEALQSMLALYGYELPVSGVFCDRTHDVVEAFQRHFRQSRVDGVADAATIDTLYRLISSKPST